MKTCPLEGRLPYHPSLSHQVEEAKDAAAPEVENNEGEARTSGDAVVGRTHLLVSTRESLRNLDEMGELGQSVAGDGESQTIAALADPLVEGRS